MKKTKKNGFTIVELVIVIAVIAILIAVLIPTFSKIIGKANESNDTQIVRQLNTAIEIESVADESKKPVTMYDANQITKDYGLDVAKLSAKSNLSIAWDSANHRFVLLDEGANKYIFPIDSTKVDQGTIENKVDFFVARQKASEANEYSVFAGENWSGGTTISLGVGFDAGDKEFTSVTYSSTAGQDVVIRTNSVNTELVVNAPNDTVKHYDYVGLVHVMAVDPTHCYEENGTAAFTQVDYGKYKTTATADVELLYVSDSSAVTVEVVKGTVDHAHAYDETEADVLNTEEKNTNLGVTFDYDENAHQNDRVDVYHHVNEDDAEGLAEGQEIAPKMSFEKPAGTTEEQIKAAFEHNKNIDEVKAVVEIVKDKEEKTTGHIAYRIVDVEKGEKKYYDSLIEAIDAASKVANCNTNLANKDGEKVSATTTVFLINDCSDSVTLSETVGLVVKNGVTYSGNVSEAVKAEITNYPNACKTYFGSLDKGLDMINLLDNEIGEIKLLDDLTLTSTLKVYCKLTLDLNGHNITSTADGWAINVYGDGSHEHKESHAETITIKNSSTTESKVSKSTAGGIITAKDGLIIDNNVTFEFSGSISEYGVIAIFDVNSYYDPTSEIRSGAKIIVSSEAGNGNVIYNTAKLELKDGCVITDNRAKNDNNEVIHQQNSGTLTTVNGGSLTTNSTAFSGSEFVVNGGVITCDTIAKSTTIKINAGEFHENTIFGYVTDSVINGGTFATDPTSYAKTDYKGEKGADDRYSLVEKPAVEDGVASVSGESFETLFEALKYACKNNIAIIDLTADSTESITVEYAMFDYDCDYASTGMIQLNEGQYSGAYAVIINKNTHSANISDDDYDFTIIDDTANNRYLILANLYFVNEEVYFTYESALAAKGSALKSTDKNGTFMDYLQKK